MDRRLAGSLGEPFEEREVVRRWVESSCDRYGLPVEIDDAGILRQVVRLMGLDAPDGSDPARIEPVVAAATSGDQKVISNGRDDRALPRE